MEGGIIKPFFLVSVDRIPLVHMFAVITEIPPHVDDFAFGRDCRCALKLTSRGGGPHVGVASIEVIIGAPPPGNGVCYVEPASCEHLPLILREDVDAIQDHVLDGDFVLPHARGAIEGYVGYRLRKSAAAPDTCGVAIEVP
jgi:hypothetical protein